MPIEVEVAPTVAPIKQRLVSKKDTGKALGGRSESSVDELIAKGLLDAVKDGRRVFIVAESIERYVASLPPHRMRLYNRRRPVPTRRRKAPKRSAQQSATAS